MTVSTIDGCVYAVPQNATACTNHWLNGWFIKLSPPCCLISTYMKTWWTAFHLTRIVTKTWKVTMLILRQLPHYPPTGTILEEMIRYQRASKRIPSLIPPGILAIDVPLSNHFIPSEEVCHVCHSSFGDPQEISNKAMIIGLTKVSSGTLIFSFF